MIVLTIIFLYFLLNSSFFAARAMRFRIAICIALVILDALFRTPQGMVIGRLIKNIIIAIIKYFNP